MLHKAQYFSVLFFANFWKTCRHYNFGTFCVFYRTNSITLPFLYRSIITEMTKADVKFEFTYVNDCLYSFAVHSNEAPFHLSILTRFAFIRFFWKDRFGLVFFFWRLNLRKYMLVTIRWMYYVRMMTPLILINGDFHRGSVLAPAIYSTILFSMFLMVLSNILLHFVFAYWLLYDVFW